MAEATYVQTGRYIDYTAGGAVALGEVINSGNVIGVATRAGVSGDVIPLDTEGVYDLTKEAALAVSIGDLVYWDATANEADKTNTNEFIGVCVKAAAGGDATVRVKLGWVSA